jgi:hypothetical protein
MSRPSKPSRNKDKTIKLLAEISVDVDVLSDAYDKERPSNWFDDPQFKVVTINEKIKDQFHWVKGSGIELLQIKQ